MDECHAPTTPEQASVMPTGVPLSLCYACNCWYVQHLWPAHRAARYVGKHDGHKSIQTGSNEHCSSSKGFMLCLLSSHSCKEQELKQAPAVRMPQQ